MRDATQRVGLSVHIDSAGTGAWHSGEAPDPRAQAVAARDGVDISAQRARQVLPQDFRQFDHIIAMDHQNLANLRKIAPEDATAQLSLMLDHAPGQQGRAVADPFYGDHSGFDATWADVKAGAQGLTGLIASTLTPGKQPD